MKMISAFYNAFKKPRSYQERHALENSRIISHIRESGGYVGNNVDFYDVKMDMSNAFLYHIGNNVTITNCRILNHDASMCKALGVTKIGKIFIGDNVFIGADSIVLPNVKIGNNVIVGAGCVISKDIPDNSVVVGNPCRIISSYNDFIEKNKYQFSNCKAFLKGVSIPKELHKEIIKLGYAYLE